ncbi:MAG TPA: ABC transporter permease [Candidatus Acidoferrales bacterium]|jgi:predicted permease|nr:ABC transporter permease [Candidatus Acidoferrales bacterium]
MSGESILQDFRFAIRQLRKSSGFAFTAILILALGICANVAIFAFADAILIRPLPYQDPSRLVGVYESIPLCPQCNLSYPDYLDWQRLNKVFTSMAVYDVYGFTLNTPAGAQLVEGARVSDAFFRTLGVNPILGRDFHAGEDLPAAPPAALLSYAAWQQRFGGKPDVIGMTVTLDGVPHTIIGVLPREFQFAPVGSAQFWSSLQPTNGCDKRRGCHDLYGVARLNDGVSVQAAAAAMRVIAKDLEAQYPDSNRGQGAAVLSLSDAILGDVRPVLLMLLSGAGLLLLIACVNVSSLLLVRSESRKREIAVRRALGASPARLVRQFVTEGLVLVAAGSALGLASAKWTMQLFLSLIPARMLAGMPYLSGIGLNLHVIAFACAVSLAAGVLFSLIPALRLSLSDLREGLTEAGRGSAGTVWRRLGSNLVVLELATAVVLLVGAALLGQSLYRLLHENIGIEAEHLATLRINAPDSSYSKDEQAVALERQVLTRMANLPGVQSAAITSMLPVSGGNTMWIKVVGRPYNGEHNEVGYRQVSSGYFTTLRARLLRGRYFTEQDDASKPSVIIIDQSFAKKYFPGEDPIGKQLSYADDRPAPPMQIVGIVDDIKEGPLDRDTWPTMYVAFNQDPNNNFSIVVRTSQAEQSLLPVMASTVHQIDSGITTFFEMTMTEKINDSPAAYLHRSSAWLVGGFAAVAFLLSVVGLYGVVSYSVSQRTREIGIRLALGAQPGSVYRLILKEAGWLTALGIAVGLVCSLAAATLMRGLLFGVRSWDLPTLAAVAIALGVPAMFASYLPARRAAVLDPVEVLRAE